MNDSMTVVSHLYVFLGGMILLYVILRLIIRSRVGLAFQAIGQNYEVARASGVNPVKYKLDQLHPVLRLRRPESAVIMPISSES